MAYYYTPREYISMAKRRVERENAVAETALSSYLAMGQAGEAAEPQFQPEAEKQESNAGFFQRTGETVLDFGKSVFDGLWKAFEGVVDFGASAVGVVAGWAGNNDLKDKISDFVAFDGLNEGLYEGRTDFFQNSFINDMSETGQRIVRGVGQGIGQMLPLVALTAATGGLAGAAGATAKGAATATKVVNFAALGMSAAGGATEQALNDIVYNEDGTQRKVTLDRAFVYGIANGAVEVGTEMLIGDGIYGKMFGEGTVNKLVNRLGKSQGFSRAVNFAFNALGEGVEEVAAEAVANTLKTIYNSKDGKVHWESPDVQDMIEAGVIGALTAAAMKGGDAAVRKLSPVMSAQDTATEIKNIERRMDSLQADGNLDEGLRTRLEAEHEASLKKLERIYDKASDKQKEKIIKNSPTIATLLDSEGKIASRTLGDGVTAISETQARSDAMSPSLYARRNEIANDLSSHQTALASDLTDVQTENVKKLRTVLKKAGTKLGNGLKVVVAENLVDANAYITKDYFVISKDQLNSTRSMAEALAHESTHFAEGTKEYDSLAKFLQETLVGRESTKEYIFKNGDKVKPKSLWEQAFMEIYEMSEAGGRADGYKISQETFDRILDGGFDKLNAEDRLAYSEIMAKAAEYVLGNEEMINRLVESERSTAKTWLRRIKERIKLIENAFKGDKAANTALKELRKAEKLFSDALAASGENYLRKARVKRQEEGDNLDNSEEVQYSKRVADYISYNSIGEENLRSIRGKVYALFRGVTDGIVNGLAVSNGDTIFIIDAGKEGGKITFGVREKEVIKNEVIRSEAIRRKNDELREKGYISDGLSSRLGNVDVVRDRGNSRQEFREDLRDNRQQSEDNERSVPRENADRRPSVTDDTQYSRRVDTGKHYSKDEARKIINGIQSSILQVGESPVFITSRTKIQELLWEKLNSTEAGKGKQASAAMEIADYIIDNAMMQSLVDDATMQEVFFTIDLLKPYLHSVDLSGIKAEVKSRYDTDNSVYAIWSKQGGIKPDVLGQALVDEGFPIRSTNEAEIFFEIADAYAKATKTIRENARTALKKTLTEEELKELRNQITLEVLRSFETHGSSTSLARQFVRAEKKITELQALLKESQKYNKQVNVVLDLARTLKPKEIERYRKSSVLADPAFEKAITPLGKINWRSDINKASTRAIIAEFANWYNTENKLLNGGLDAGIAQDELKKNGQAGYINSDIIEILDYFKSTVGERTALTMSELRGVEYVLRSAKYILDNYDKVTLRGKQVVLSAVAREQNAVVDKYSGMHKHKSSIVEGIRKFGYNTVEPRVVFLSMVGYEEDGALMRAFDDITDGETRSGAIRLDLVTQIDEFMREHKNYKKRLANDKITVAGHEISVQTAISLYMLSKQEHSIGGLKEGGWGYRDTNGYWVDCGTLTDAEINELASSLSEADKAFCKTLRKFFDTAGEYMRETDIADHGYSRVQTENSDYFPIVRYAGDQAKSVDQTWMQEMTSLSVQNTSIAKERVKNVRRIDVQPVLSVIEKHAKQIGQYAGLLIPIKNIQRIYNLNVSQTRDVSSIRNTINEKTWKGFNDYFVKWLSDIQGVGKNGNEADSIFGKLRSNFAKFQLGANLKVVISQIASFPTAFSVLSAGAMTRAFGHKVSFENMDKYCPWARVRNADHGVVLAEGNLDKIGAVGDAFTKPIQWMDRATIGFLWNACQCEVESNHKGDAAYAYGTEANLQEAGKLLEKVGRLTQPNYTQAERSGLQRVNNELVKSFSMFFSVPLKQYSRAFEAIGRYRALKYKKNVLHENVTKAEMNAARKGLARTATAITMANILYVLMGQFVKFLLNKDRKDKDGEEISVVEDAFHDFLSTSVGMIPMAKEVYNVFIGGFQMEEAVTSSLNDMFQGTKGILDMLKMLSDGESYDKKDIARPLRDFIYAAGQFAGIPTRNLYNLVFGVVNRFDESEAYKWNSLFYSQNYTKDLKKAIEDGDESKASTIIGLMLGEDGMTSTSALVNKKLRELYGKGYSVLPKTVRDSITYDGETIALSKKQQEAFKKVYAGANKEVETLISSSYFNSLSEEVQAKAIKWIYDYYYETAVCETVGEDSNSKKRLFAETMPVSKFALSIAACSAVEGRVNRKGNTIAGSKKAEVLKLLNKLSLTRAEKVLILAYLGYSVDRYASIIKSYISRIGLTKAQQKAFLAYCGL